MRYGFGRLGIGAACVMIAGLTIGCGGGEDEEEPQVRTSPAATAPAGAPGGGVEITADARQEAEQIYVARCITCHGEHGEGDGPGAAALDPKPRNYHDAEWQKITPDDEIERAIVFGGASVGKSPQMAPNPDLASKPAVVAALREKVRGFGK